MPGPQYLRGAKPIFFGRSLRTSPALPKLVSHCGDFLLVGHVGGVAAMLCPVLVLGMQVSLIGVLLGLSGAFVSGQVIFFSVVLGAGTMGMGGEVTVFGSYLLRFAHSRCLCTYCTVRREGLPKVCKICNLGESAHFALRVQLLHPDPRPSPLTVAFSSGPSRALDHPVQGLLRVPTRERGVGNDYGIYPVERVPGDP
jgi:hypothetical protein